MKTIRVGTRESRLAIAQSRLITEMVRARLPQYNFQLVPIKTRGDLILDKRLDELGGKGLFIKELENALIDGRIDIAVHSAKDMPSLLPDGLVIAAVSEREDPRDVLVARNGKRLEELGEGSVIGTGSVRREVQLLQRNSMVTVSPLRGNVLTRLDSLTNGQYDAIMLAMAGLKRMGLEDRCTQCFEAEDFIPAAGQGILVIEARGDYDASYLMESVHCEEAALCLSAERAYMHRLDGGCSKPVAAHAVIEGDVMRVYGMYASESKTDMRRECIEGNKQNAEGLGQRLAELVLGR
ncbi:hydroxymethylbilane synthase [Anaerobacterium chartisolvens]|nr:hydroxymethylbilane synthase [Anaerobacterium chartisolvens]